VAKTLLRRYVILETGNVPASRPHHSADDVAEKMIKFVHEVQGYSLPRLLISIVGGNHDDDTRPFATRMLRRGLRRVAHTLKAWIVRCRFPPPC
jgi:hypothetical protein